MYHTLCFCAWVKIVHELSRYLCTCKFHNFHSLIRVLSRLDLSKIVLSITEIRPEQIVIYNLEDFQQSPHIRNR